MHRDEQNFTKPIPCPKIYSPNYCYKKTISIPKPIHVAYSSRQYRKHSSGFLSYLSYRKKITPCHFCQALSVPAFKFRISKYSRVSNTNNIRYAHMLTYGLEGICRRLYINVLRINQGFEKQAWSVSDFPICGIFLIMVVIHLVLVF